MLNRIIFFIYSVVAYLIFFGTFLYAIGFIGNFAVPTTLDGPAVGPFLAEPADKRRATRFIRRAAQCNGTALV